METIADLNARWWYRLVKVVFILWLMSSAMLSVVFFFFEYSPDFDKSSSYVICDSGNKIKPQDYGVSLYSDNIWSDDDQKLRGACLPDTLIGAKIKKTFPDAVSSDGKMYVDFSDSELGSKARGTREGRSLIAGLQYVGEKNYNLIAEYYPRDWFSTIAYSLLWVTIQLIIFEISRRVFYYIVLGKVFPKKR